MLLALAAKPTKQLEYTVIHFLFYKGEARWLSLLPTTAFVVNILIA